LVLKMEIFNTLSNKKEKIEKPKKGFLKLFVCGPTVYNYPHIGHARTYLVFDAFVRFLRTQNFKIFYLQNITDVDDKIINKAKELRRNPLDLARFFEKEYKKIMKKIGVISVDKYARASDYIKEIQGQIDRLLKKGFAYQIEDGIYYDISKFKDYGKLSRRTSLQAEDAISRIDESIAKRNKGDFCLWKKVNYNLQNQTQKQISKSNFQISENGEPCWPSPWGWGRPGWHIEDTAITEKFFGPQYNIHGGGIDLKFPHHEAEIAQMEAISGRKPFVKIWMHTGALSIENKKMSKSLKNFILISDFLKKYSPEVLRFFVLSYHYRSPINYSEEIIFQSQKSLQNIKEFLEKLKLIASSKKKSNKSFNIKPTLNIIDKNFIKALNDDFNTPKALSIIFDMISSWQNQIWQFNKKQAKDIAKFTQEKLKILGIELKPEKIPQKIKILAQKRELLRRNKQFVQSDLLRKKIEMLGYKVEDTPLGSLILKNF